MSEVARQSESNGEPLSWLAFRYVSNEMMDTEVAEFEARLDYDSPEFDQAACDAVVRVVQLSDAIVLANESAVPCVTSPSSLSGTVRRDVVARRISLLVASITVLVVGWTLTLPIASLHLEVVDSPALLEAEQSLDVSCKLVQIWASPDDELVLPAEEAHLLPVDDLPEHFRTDVPDWLLAAVQSRDASLTSSEVMEN